MDTDTALRLALHEMPAEETAWLALADWLEETNRPDQARLLRLHRLVRRMPWDASREPHERELRELLGRGVRPSYPTLTNSLGMQLILVPAGAFFLDAHTAAETRSSQDGPNQPQEVEIPRPFYLGACPVTQNDFLAVMESNPSHFGPGGTGQASVRGLDSLSFPVEMVTWDEAVRFCQLLSQRPAEKEAGLEYRLPAEAEWEYACRAAGSCSAAFQFGDGLSSAQANFDGNHPAGRAATGPYLERPTAVGSYPCNALGLFDMHGNIYEWCADWFDGGLHPTPHRDLADQAGTARVVRGGSWFSPGSSCRSSYRGSNSPRDRSFIIGFRVACDASGGPKLRLWGQARGLLGASAAHALPL
jgi:uncharacterized protein (TIGR02996 family)